MQRDNRCREATIEEHRAATGEPLAGERTDDTRVSRYWIHRAEL